MRSITSNCNLFSKNRTDSKSSKPQSDNLSFFEVFFAEHCVVFCLLKVSHEISVVKDQSAGIETEQFNCNNLKKQNTKY